MLANKLNVLVQMAFDRSPELPDVPSALDLVSDPAARQVLELILRRQEMGRPLAAPPGHALARVATAEFENYAKLNKKVPPEVVGVVQQIEDHAKLAVSSLSRHQSRSTGARWSKRT